MLSSVFVIFLLMLIKDCMTSRQKWLGSCNKTFSRYFALQPVNFSTCMYCLMKTCHLQSSTNSLLIQVNLTDSIKAIRLTILTHLLHIVLSLLFVLACLVFYSTKNYKLF